MEIIRQLLGHELERLGTTQEPSVLDKLAHYVALVLRWGQRINLTGTPEAAPFIQRQLPDGLILSHWLAGTTAGDTVLDVGTGAGIPGMIVAMLCPQRQVTLVEPNGRRCSFLRTVSHELDLGCQVVASRLEQAALEPAAVACSRATWSPEDWLARSASLVIEGGTVVAFVAEASPRVIPDSLEPAGELSYQLADGTPRRQLLYRKRAPRFT